MVEEIIARIKGASDLYDILDIEKDVDESGLTKAYRKLAMKLHPDKCQLEGAEEAFKKVSGAYSQLKDPQQRAHYDRFGGSSDAVGGGAGGNPFAGAQPFDPNELFREIFKQQGMSGGGMPAGFATAGGGMPGGMHFSFNGVPMHGGPGGVGVQQLRMPEIPEPFKTIVGLVPPPLLVFGGMALFFAAFSWIMGFIFEKMPFFIVIYAVPAPGRVKWAAVLMLMGASFLGFV